MEVHCELCVHPELGTGPERRPQLQRHLGGHRGAAVDDSVLRRRRDGIGDARAFLRAVVGCSAIVSTGFSQRAVTLLRAVGIRPVVIGGRVDEVLDRVARGTIRQAT